MSAVRPPHLRRAALIKGPASASLAGSESLIARATSLAEEAHGSKARASDGHLFIEHVHEVADLLSDAGFDEELVATGLLHDSVERGTLTAKRLRREMPKAVADLVLALTEDARLESFDARKTALRKQVETTGDRALTVFAADKLSDIVGLDRGVKSFGSEVEARIGTTVASMAAHYRGSVEMIATHLPDSPFLPGLFAELDRLDANAE